MISKAQVERRRLSGFRFRSALDETSYYDTDDSVSVTLFNDHPCAQVVEVDSMFAACLPDVRNLEEFLNDVEDEILSIIPLSPSVDCLKEDTFGFMERLSEHLVGTYTNNERKSELFLHGDVEIPTYYDNTFRIDGSISRTGDLNDIELDQKHSFLRIICALEFKKKAVDGDTEDVSELTSKIDLAMTYIYNDSRFLHRII